MLFPEVRPGRAACKGTGSLSSFPSLGTIMDAHGDSKIALSSFPQLPNPSTSSCSCPRTRVRLANRQVALNVHITVHICQTNYLRVSHEFIGLTVLNCNGHRTRTMLTFNDFQLKRRRGASHLKVFFLGSIYSHIDGKPPVCFFCRYRLI